MSFHTKLKELRLQNNLSQEQVARKLDITTRPYIEYEKGRKYPSVKTLAKMAELFGVSISFLMDEQNESSADAQVQKLKYGTFRADKLVEEISGLFAGRKLSEADKDAVMEALQEAYWAAKKKNKRAQL